MKTFILLTVVACAAAAGRITLSDANKQKCTLTKAGSALKSSCDFSTSVTSLNGLASRVATIETKLNALLCWWSWWS